MHTTKLHSLALLICCLAAATCDRADEDGPDEATAPALFAIGTGTFGPEGTQAYLRLVPALDLAGAEVTLDEAREFPGQADIAAHGGHILVASGDEPTITRFSVDDSLVLVEGERVGFASYGLRSAAFWNNQFVADDRAYMVNGATELIVWNPSTMTIEDTIVLPEPEPRPGLALVAGLADRSSVVHDGKFYLPMYWTDSDYADRSDDSLIVVVDIATNLVETTISAACPGLDYATVDDAGMLHFSNWTGGVGTHYVLGTAQNCIATVDPGSGEVTTKTFASITGGHEGAAFEYAGDGRFVMSVFDELRADAANAEEPFGIVGGINWRLWSYDPKAGDAMPIEAVDWNSGAVVHAGIGDQLYAMVPGADYKNTSVYLLGADRDATAAFDVKGWSFRLFQLR